MGSHTPHRKQNLGQFLLSLLDKKEIRGLEWIDRDCKRFKIPWPDKRNRVWANVENIMLKKWEICNGRFKEGNALAWTTWKQTFRGALNKTPFVSPVTDMHRQKDPNMPYRVYEFTDAVNISDPNSFMKRKKCKKPPTSLLPTWGHCQAVFDSDSVSPPGNKNVESPNTCNQTIPQVVLELSKSHSDSSDDSNDSNNINNNTHTEIDGAYLNVSPSSSVSPHFKQEEEAMDVIHNLNDFIFGSGLPQGNSHRCPSVANHQYHGGYTCDDVDQHIHTPVERHNPDFSPSPDPYYLNPDPDQVRAANVIGSAVGDPDSASSHVRFQAYYFHHLNVLEGTVNYKGIRLFSGQPTMDRLTKQNIHPTVWQKIKGPDYFKQVELPDATQCGQNLAKYDSKQCRHLADILNSMKRGVLLFYMERKLFVYRLCRSHVFASYGRESNVIINRKNKSEQQIFCMETFEKQFNLHKINPRQNPCPSPKVTLTFGTEWGMEPVVHLELTVLEAESWLRRETPNVGGDVLISGFDSVDHLVEGFNHSITINNSL